MIMRSGTPSRILMTTDTVGGVWTYTMDLARALGQEGVEIALASLGGHATVEQRHEARTIRTLELYESDYRLPWMDHPWEDVRHTRDWLLDLVTRVRPDVVHLNEPVYGSVPWPVPSLAMAHSCVLSWWQSVWNGPAPEEWNRYRREMTQGLQAADAVAAPSAWMLENLRRFYGVASGRVVPNGREPGEITPGNKAPLVFAAGRLWDPAKNLLALESVAERLPWPIYVAGEPRHPGRENGVSANHLHLLEQLPSRAVAAWLRKASIYAFPAKYEPFGLSVLEAALAGCALVLGDVPPLRELWDGAAVFVSPEDPQTLRLALEGMIEEPDLRQALAMRARKRALGFTPRRMAVAYLEVYSDLLSGRPSHAKESACVS
jgi:glycogen(starch) synthase